MTMLDHSALLYGTEDQFRTAVGPFLAEGIERSEAVLAVTTAPNIELLHDHLGRDARHVEFIDASGFYTTPAAALESFKAFAETKLDRGVSWVRVVGEPLWPEGCDSEVRLWTRYESMFNLVFAASPMTVVCPYDERCVGPEILRQAHHTHPRTIGEGGISPSPDYADPGRFALEPE
jgi:hypothetical protein